MQSFTSQQVLLVPLVQFRHAALVFLVCHLVHEDQMVLVVLVVQWVPLVQQVLDHHAIPVVQSGPAALACHHCLVLLVVRWVRLVHLGRWDRVHQTDPADHAPLARLYMCIRTSSI